MLQVRKPPGAADGAGARVAAVGEDHRPAAGARGRSEPVHRTGQLPHPHPVGVLAAGDQPLQAHGVLAPRGAREAAPVVQDHRGRDRIVGREGHDGRALVLAVGLQLVDHLAALHVEAVARRLRG